VATAITHTPIPAVVREPSESERLPTNVVVSGASRVQASHGRKRRWCSQWRQSAVAGAPLPLPSGEEEEEANRPMSQI
jgi:hypothetical protein